MNKNIKIYPKWIFALAAFVVIFGIATIKEGASVLFFDGEARTAAGHYVPFVLWFNFLAGIFYILTGIGIIRRCQKVRWIALGVACSTLLIFAALGIHIAAGNPYETRTLFAMSLRTTVWMLASFLLFRFRIKPDEA